ncbi:2-oxo acid dehydrogenase subunit E2 [Nocardia sp. NPDC046473]|uniref:2-oxo acid dehydrogenase subunit E2 n=1 Tax=Nocardia sp. NPDC046473 TaxID=3155733 RepID=UPI0033F6A5E0
MAEFRMPSLGADMEHGTLLQWHVKPGDTVHKGDIVAEVDTAKAAIEVECFDDGTIGEILVPEGATVPVGTVLATIEPVGAKPAVVDAPPARPKHGRPKTSRSLRRDGAGKTAAVSPVVPHILATPLIRRLAEEAGIELSSIHGSGHDGRILRADVARVVAAQAPPPPLPTAQVATDTVRPAHVRASGYARRLADEREIDLSSVPGTGPDGAIQADDVRAARTPTVALDADVRMPVAEEESAGHETAQPARTRQPAAPQHGQADMRRAIAAAMTHSKQTIPHYYLSSTIDLAAATAWLREVNQAAPVPDRIIMAALQLRAVALAARKVPAVNGYWADDEFQPADTVDIGVIVSLRGGGIIAPTIAGADTLAVREVMVQLRGAVSRARSGRLLSSDTAAATITVTNLGEMGVDSVIGVIAPPQVAIVGFGTVGERPCAIDGLLGVRPQVTVTLAADHRASDGAVGARFLNTVAELLQHPDQL